MRLSLIEFATFLVWLPTPTWISILFLIRFVFIIRLAKHSKFFNDRSRLMHADRVLQSKIFSDFFNNSQIWNVCFALTPDHRANEHFVLGKLFLRVKTSRSSKLSLHKNKSLFRALVNIELCLRNVYHSENVCKMNYVWRKFTQRTHAFMKRRLTVGWTDG